MTHREHDLSWTIPRSGETLAGKYVVDGPCGRGGLAVVLSAMHVALDQRVAIKVLLPEWGCDAEVVERFLREGRAATRIRSEHVVRVFDVGTLESGAPYLVLEYLEGRNLEEVINTWGPLPVPTAIDWLLQAAEAIGEAHALGIVHRDLKPGNLFLTRRADGSACVKVIDFGLSKLTDPRMRGASAKLTRPTDVMGSPHYMAPEQLRATRDADARADLWALGAVLHELLTGRPPFAGETVPAICASILMEQPPPVGSLRASVPPPVEQAVLRCLEKEPEARFASITELARALAPFGTSLARSSCERIERVFEQRGSVSGLSLLPPLPPLADEEVDPEPVMSFVGPASGRMVAGALCILTGLGAAVLMLMYGWVHANDPHAAGVTAQQPPAPVAQPVPPAKAAPEPSAPPPHPTAAPPPAPRAQPVPWRAPVPAPWHPPSPRGGGETTTTAPPAPSPPAADVFDGRK